MNRSLALVLLGFALVWFAPAARGQTVTTITNTTAGHGLFGLAWGGMVGNQVTIYGSGFPNVTAVSFGGVNALTGQFGTTTPTTIIATIPPGAQSGQVTVTFTGGVVRTAPQPFTVIPTGPYVRSFTPVSGNSNTTVVIQGALLQGFTAVRFNGVNAQSAFYGPSQNEITCLPPVGVTTGPISVVSNAFVHTTTSNFFAAPVLNSFSPAVGRAGTNVVLTGTNLAGTTHVWFNGIASSFTVNHGGQITATVPTGASTGKITVFAPGGSVESAGNFVVLPTILGFTPNVGRPGTNVVITGANLNEGTSAVRFGSVNASFTVNGPTQITAVVPNNAVTSPISVTTTNGSHTNDALFYLPPRITSFTPTNAPPGNTVTVNGTNFLGASAVLFNGVPAVAFFNVSNFTLQATVPAGFVTGPISVTTPAGTTNSAGLYYAAPVISGFTPVHGLPGTNVLIQGASFLGASQVLFGGVPASSFTVLSNFAVRATVPTNAVSGPLTLTAPAGTTVSAGVFLLDNEIPVPPLTASLTGAGQIQLAWLTNVIPFTLQATTNPADPAGWANVATPPVALGNSNVVTEPATNALKFYRLKK
ncbi:MAG: hypothetical protein ACK45B_10475 [Limisphaerales bacterium]